MKKVLVVLVAVSLLSACSGVRRTGDTVTTHAEAFHILGLTIPEDDQAKARSLVPAGTAIHTVYSSPSDWTSFWGFVTRILGFSTTQISGQTSGR